MAVSPTSVSGMGFGGHGDSEARGWHKTQSNRKLAQVKLLKASLLSGMGPCIIFESQMYVDWQLSVLFVSNGFIRLIASDTNGLQLKSLDIIWYNFSIQEIGRFFSSHKNQDKFSLK